MVIRNWEMLIFSMWKKGSCSPPLGKQGTSVYKRIPVGSICPDSTRWTEKITAKPWAMPWLVPIMSPSYTLSTSSMFNPSKRTVNWHGKQKLKLFLKNIFCWNIYRSFHLCHVSACSNQTKKSRPVVFPMILLMETPPKKKLDWSSCCFLSLTIVAPLGGVCFQRFLADK